MYQPHEAFQHHQLQDLHVSFLEDLEGFHRASTVWAAAQSPSASGAAAPKLGATGG